VAETFGNFNLFTYEGNLLGFSHFISFYQILILEVFIFTNMEDMY